MNERCPNYESCPVYGCFRLTTTKNAIISIFCEGNFENCERKKIKDNGGTVPEKLLPDGQYLD
jgi:hypothetical protein